MTGEKTCTEWGYINDLADKALAMCVKVKAVV